MFAVPGWNLDAGSIKAQEPTRQTGRKGDGDHGKSKKRKRVKDADNSAGEDLSRLWEKHVKPNVRGKDELRGSKKRKQSSNVHSGGNRGPERVPDGEKTTQIQKAQPASHEPALGKDHQGKPGLSDEWSGFKEDAQESSNIDGVDKDIAKAKYEERKTSSSQRKERKAHLRENGEMPPKRTPPKAVGDSATAEKKSKKPKTRTADQTSNLSSIRRRGAPSESQAPSNDSSSRSTAAKDLDSLLQNGSRRPKPSSKPKPSIPSVPSPSPSPSPPPPTLPTIPTAPSKLTPLQQRMRQKLISARFRHLNQTLYTSPSSHSANLFASSPEIFASYHAGFEAQVAVWPQNPVDLFVRDILQRGKIKAQGGKSDQRYQGRGGMQSRKQQIRGNLVQPPGKSDPLPRSAGVCHIADLGCGNASLSASLQRHLSSLHLNIQSFDLAKPEGVNAKLVTVADITSLPPKILKDGGVDVVICCLSLMPTNWPKIVDTAARILRVGGEAWVAEVRSRFARKKRRHGGKADDHLVALSRAKDGKKGDDEGDVDDDRMVDEDEDIVMSTSNLITGPKKGKKVAAEVLMSKDGEETDLAPFIEVWKRRGMEVREMDQGNKMFVGVKFVKRRLVGKEESDGEEEAKVLKPCVYKLR